MANHGAGDSGQRHRWSAGVSWVPPTLVSMTDPPMTYLASIALNLKFAG